MQKYISMVLNAVRGFVSNTWKRFTLIQKLIVIGIALIFIAGIVGVSTLSMRPDRVYLFTNGVDDTAMLTRITTKLDTENIEYQIDSNNRISLSDKKTALYARSLLIQEDLIPGDVDPWELFDTQRWTQTDFERNVNLQRAITKQVEQHIEALDDVDDAQVTLVMPEDTLFTADKKPVTASVILRFKPGSDFTKNRKKVEGVERLIMLAVEGLLADNLVISDANGVRLNDFKNLADFDSLEQTKREMAIKKDFENQYKNSIIKALSDIYTPDRVRIVNIDMEIDFSKKKEEIVENFPIVKTKDNPATPYDETEVVLAIPRSQEDVSENYSGTGFNPEGPPGLEGQTPPSYKDLDGIVGSWDHTSKKINNEINQKKIVQESRPTVSRVSASVAIDGLWEKEYDEETGKIVVLLSKKISRKYIPLDKKELEQAQALVESAVGFSQDRGDSISVENVKFDRNEQFAREDALYQRQLRIRRIVGFISIGLLMLVSLFLLVRIILRQIERARARKEEKLVEQYRRMRENQIMEMSEYEDEDDEESELQKLTNDVQQVVSQNPEQISILIRSWMEV